MSNVVLITGGAARIGAQIAHTLHDAGFTIALHYRHSQAQARALTEQLNGLRAESAALFQADLSEYKEVIALSEKVTHHYGKLDVLVNNASSFYPTAIGEVTEQHWDDLFSANTKAAFFLSQAFTPLLKESRGSIINIVDIHSEKPMKGHSVYCMAKAALNMMTLALAKDLGPNIRVNGVSPGAILWPEHEADDAAKHRSILKRIPLQKMGDPTDIAQAVAFLVAQKYMTGHILNVDGGRSLAM